MTCFSGLVIYLTEFAGLKQELQRCFRHEQVVVQYGFWRVFLFLMLLIITGYRKLSDIAYLANDPFTRPSTFLFKPSAMRPF